MASIWGYRQSNFACMGHGTGILKEKTFQEVLGTFRGQKDQKRGFLGKKWSFWSFSNSHHQLQFGPFDILISHARAMEMGLWRKIHFGRSWAHLGGKMFKKVNFWGKNGYFDLFPKATTGFNLVLLTIQFCAHRPWNYDFEGKDILGCFGHI